MRTFLSIAVLLVAGGCAHSSERANYEVTSQHVEAGSEVKRGESSIPLADGTLTKGDDLSQTLSAIGVSLEGPAVVSIVPSIDTPVCEEQTHILGETDTLNPAVQRITISRDTAMAQARFASNAGLEGIDYGSDFKHATFGKKTGLLMKGSELLARAVVVVDKNGVVEHVQVVPDITNLPDMEEAFQVANRLVEGG